MTAPLCKDCAYVRWGDVFDREPREVCGVRKIVRPLCIDQRAPDGPCGPDAKLFAKRQGDK